MAKTIDIALRHITRTEGHGDLRVRATDGVIEEVSWQVPEAPRFFEALVRGRRWDDLQTVVSRICGICSVTHTIAALKAMEDAMQLPVSAQTQQLRALALCGEIMESHLLHIGYLVTPDLLGVNSIVPLATSHPALLHGIIRLHRLSNRWIEIIAGRRTHPVAFRPGGMGALPLEADLRALLTSITEAIPELQTLVDLLCPLWEKLPAFTRATEYVSLHDTQTYPWYDGAISSSDTSRTTPAQQFTAAIQEYVAPHSTAKWTRWHRESYAVGARARFNLNGRYLKPFARELARQFALHPPCHQPFLNTICQLVEVAQVLEQGRDLLDTLLTGGLHAEHMPPQVTPRAGWGAGVVEAPRGLLFHSYAFNEHGICTDANMIIPTNQNHANLQRDLEVFLPQIIEREPEEIRLLLEMLIRAYDPCISCSTHYLEVIFV